MNYINILKDKVTEFSDHYFTAGISYVWKYHFWISVILLNYMYLNMLEPIDMVARVIVSGVLWLKNYRFY